MQTSQTERELADTIGEFLTEHGEGPRVEHIDNVRWDDVDVRQDAMYRCLRVFDKNGVVVTDDTLVELLTEHKYAAVRNLSVARIDAVRRLRGRGSQRGRDKRTVRANFSADGEDDQWVWTGEFDGCGAQDALIDPCGNHAHEFIENDYGEELQRVYANATQTEQKAIRILAEWQRRKECGENTYPLRKPIHKIKAKLKAEGSLFDLNPRYL